MTEEKTPHETQIEEVSAAAPVGAPEPVEDEQATEVDPEGVLKLRRPVVFEGKTYEKIPYDFCRVTRADIRKWARNKQKRDGIVVNIVVDIDGQESIFCLAAGIPVEMLDCLDVRDYNEALGTAAGFFG